MVAAEGFGEPPTHFKQGMLVSTEHLHSDVPPGSEGSCSKKG